jgi:hypothetical protein
LFSVGMPLSKGDLAIAFVLFILFLAFLIRIIYRETKRRQRRGN